MTTPTPLPRARARFFAFLALFLAVGAPPAQSARTRAAAAPAEAALEWVKVEYAHNGKTYVYYYPKNKPYTNDGGHERINLYKEPVLDDAHMARSHLWRNPGSADKSFSLHLITESDQGAASDIVKAAKNWKASPHQVAKAPVQPAPAQPAPAQPAPAQPAPTQPGPAPVDPATGATVKPPDAPAPINNGVVVGQNGGPLDQLAGGMKQEARWEDVAKRVIEWTWKEREGGRTFITPDARKNAATKPAFEAAMNEVVKDKDHWNSALHVYYVLGPGEPVPAWVTGDPALKKLLVDDQERIKAAKLADVLAQCLDRWQHNPTGKVPEKCDKQADRSQVRMPYPAKDLATWPRDFLTDAGREARVLLQAVKVGTGTISGNVGGAPTTVGDAPGGSGPRNPRLPAMPTGEFGTDQLFGKWGDANVFSLDGRILAVVIRTNKKVEPGEPPKVTLTNVMGLYDISNSGDIYGKRFDMNAGEQSFSLIPGGKTYSISLTPKGDDMALSIKGGSGAEPQVSNGAKTLPTVNELFQNRARQALDSGNRVSIGGRIYRVTGEATNTGNVLFWDEKDLLRQAGDIESDRPGRQARYWVPNMMAEVDEMRDGRTQNISDKASLGFAVNGQWQGLRWENGTWVPAQGDEFKPKAPPPPAPPAGTPPAGGTPPGPTTPGTPPPPGQGRPGLAAALNAKLSDDVKAVTGFLDVETPKKFGEHLIIARLKSDGSPAEGRMTHPQYVGLVDGAGAGDLDESIVAGRWLQTKSSKGYKYFDLKNFDLVKDGANLKILGDSGDLTLGEGFKGIRDKTVLSVVLKLAGYTGDESKIVANLDAAAKGSSNWLVAGFEKTHGGRISVSVDNKNCSNIWPKLTLNSCSGGPDQAPGSVPGAGQGLALDAAGNIQYDANLPFGEEWQNAEGKTARRVDPKPADAALYQAADGDRKLWYLSFAAAGSDNKKVKRMPSLVFSDAKEGAGGMRYPKKPVTISGLTVKGDPDVSYSLRAVMGEGSLEESGFIGAYTTSSNDSCVGVVASWGMTPQSACSKCGAKWENARCVSTK